MFLLPKPKSGAVHCEVEAPLERNIIGFKIEKTCLVHVFFYIWPQQRLSRSTHQTFRLSIIQPSDDIYNSIIYNKV